jgi:hypothetical protein
MVSGCALKVIPEQIEGGVIDSKDGSLTIKKDNIAISVRGDDTELYSYNLDGTVYAFSAVIDNQGTTELPISTDAFILMDSDGRQYLPLTPEKVKEIITKDSYYLIPYPYVGFYYLEDYKKSSFYNTFNSQIPYYYEMYPQDIYTKALTTGTIIPKAKVIGLLYFRIDLSGKTGMKLLFYKKDTPKSAPADFVFPFKISK